MCAGVVSIVRPFIPFIPSLYVQTHTHTQAHDARLRKLLHTHTYIYRYRYVSVRGVHIHMPKQFIHIVVSVINLYVCQPYCDRALLQMQYTQ